MKKYLVIILFFVVIFVGYYFVQKDGGIVPGLVDTSEPSLKELPIENVFEDKVVYTTDMDADTEKLKADCQKRGGAFNECGSVCEKEADTCIAVCAYTCELGNIKPEEARLDVVTEEAELSAVSGQEGSGIATREYDGLAFIHTVTAFLDNAPAGKFYEGWLVKKDSEPLFFSTGELEPQGGGYGLVYSVNEDKSDYTEIVVTLESEANGLDGIPEVHVLEGEF